MASASPTLSLDATPLAPSQERFATSKPSVSVSSCTSGGDWSETSCSSLGGDHSGDSGLGGANDDDEHQHGLGLSFGFPSPPSEGNNGDCTPVRTPSATNLNAMAAAQAAAPARPPRRQGSSGGLEAAAAENRSGSAAGTAPHQHVVGGLARNASVGRPRSTSTSSRPRQRAVSSGSTSATRAAAASRSPRTRKAKEMDLGGQIDLAMSFVAEGPFSQPPPLPANSHLVKAAHAQQSATAASPSATISAPRPSLSSNPSSSARTDTQEAFKAALAAIGRSVAVAPARSVDDKAEPDDEALLSTLRALAESSDAAPSDLLRPESSASMVSTLSGESYASSTASGSGRLTWGDALRRGTGVTSSITRPRDFGGDADADASTSAVVEEATRVKFRRARVGGGYHPASRPASRGASRRPSGMLTSASTPEGALGRIALPSYGGEMSASSSGDSWRLDGVPQAEDLRRASRALEEEEEVLLSTSGHSHPAADDDETDELDARISGIQHAPLSEGIAREAALRERAEREAQASYSEAKRTEAESVALRAGIKWLLASHEAVTERLTAALEAPRPAPAADTLSWLQYAPSSPPATEAAPSIAPSTRSRSRSILRAFSRPRDAQQKVNAFITGSSAPGMGVSMPSNRLSVLPDAAQTKRNQGQAEIAAALSRFTGAREGSLRAKEVSPRAYLRAMPEDDGDVVDPAQPWTAGWGASSSGDLTRMSMDRKSRTRADSSARGSVGPHSPRTSSSGGLLPPSLPDETDVEALKLALAQARMATARAEQEKRRLREEVDELTSRIAVENAERLRVERVKIAGLEKEVEGLRAQVTRTARKGAGGDAITEGAFDEAEAGMMEAVKEAAMATAQAEEEAARLREQMEGLESRCNVLEEALYHAVAAVAHTRMESGGVDVTADPAIVAAQMWDDAEASFEPPAVGVAAAAASSSLPKSEASGAEATEAPSAVGEADTKSASVDVAASPQPLSTGNLDHLSSSQAGAEQGRRSSAAESIGTADDAASLVLPRRRFSDSMTSFYSADGGRSPLSTYGAIEYGDDEDEAREVTSPVSELASPRIPNGLVNAMHSRTPSEARASPDVVSPATAGTTAERRGASIAPLVLSRTQASGTSLYSPSMPNTATTFKRLSRGLGSSPVVVVGDRDLPPRPPEPSSPLPPPPGSAAFNRSPDPNAASLPHPPSLPSSARSSAYVRGAPGFAASSPVSEHASRPPWATSSLSEASTTSRTDTASPASIATSTSPVIASKGMGSGRLGIYSLPQLSTVGRLDSEFGGSARNSASATPFSVSPLGEHESDAQDDSNEPVELLPDVEYAHDTDEFDAEPVKLARHSSISSTKSKRLTKEAKLAARNRTRSASNKMRSSIASTEAPSFASSGSGESSGDAARRIAQATLLGSQIRRGGFNRSTRSISSISSRRSDMPSIADMPSAASITSGAARWTAPRTSASQSVHSVPSTPTDLHSPRSPMSPTHAHSSPKSTRSVSSSSLAATGGSESFTRRRNYGSQLRESPRVGL